MKEEEKEKRKRKNYSIFQITAFVLTILLVIAILVQIVVMFSLKDNTNNLKKDITEIPEVENMKEDNILQLYRNSIENINLKAN